MSRAKYCHRLFPTYPAALLALSIAQTAHGEAIAIKHHFDIPAQPLNQALLIFGKQSGQALMYGTDIADNLRSHALQGDYTAEEAINILLVDTPLRAIFTDEGTVTVKPKQDDMYNKAGPGTMPPVTVRGTALYDGVDPYTKGYARTNAFSATKTDTPLLQTPGSINVITQRQIKDRQAWTPEEALKYTSGVNAPSSGGRTPFDTAFILRGFGTGQKGDLGGFYYRDGFRMSGIPISMGSVERIELLKGPASVLYGRAEPGGLINVVYKKPQATPYYSLEQQFGSYDFYRTSVDATGPLTDDNSLLYRVTLQNVNSNSFTRYVENDFFSVSPSLTWIVDDRTQVNFQFEYSHNDWTYPQGVPAIGGQISNLPPDRLLELSNPSNPDGSVDNFVASIDLKHDFNANWSVNLKGLYANQELTWMRGGRVSVSSIDPATGDVGSGSILGEPDDDRDWWYTTMNLAGKFDTFGVKHHMLFGFDFMRERFSGPYFFQGLRTELAGYNIYRPDGRQIPRPSRQDAIDRGFWYALRNDWYGIYIQDQIDITDQLHLTLGGRYDNATYFQGGPQSAFHHPITDEALNPRYGIVYQPLPWLSAYYQYQESFGTSNGRSRTNSVVYKPQTSQQHEAGLKAEWFDGALSSTLAFYHLTKQNLLTSDPDNVGASIAVGEARSQGIELDVVGRITDKLNIIGSYTYTDTKITKDNNGTQGNRLPNVPDSSGSLWLSYDVTDAFTVGSGAYIAGKRQGDAANSYQLPGYVRWDAMAAYKWRIGGSALTAQVNINNLLDKTYYTNAAGLHAFPGAPLTVLGSLRLEY